VTRPPLRQYSLPPVEEALVDQVAAQRRPVLREGEQEVVDLELGVPTTEVELERDPLQDDELLGSLARELDERAAREVALEHLAFVIGHPEPDHGVHRYVGLGLLLRDRSQRRLVEPVDPVRVAQHETDVAEIADTCKHIALPPAGAIDQLDGRHRSCGERSGDRQMIDVEEQRHSVRGHCASQAVPVETGIGRSGRLRGCSR
jgi:hypothetical protein